MKQNELPEYSVYILTEYYKNNIHPFLDAFADNCLWLGPAQGQMIWGREALHEAFAQENNQLTFSMWNLQVVPLPVSDTSLDVVVTYVVRSYYADDVCLDFQQRTELLWVQESVRDEEGAAHAEYRIRSCHISNEFPYDGRDVIYPNHFTDLPIAQIYRGGDRPYRTELKGLLGSYFYLADDTILWIENKKSHTLIHTLDREYESVEHINTIVEKYRESLCKVHISYAVNPLYVTEIGRFYVQLEDGTRLPVPEKRYTKIKEELRDRMEALRKE